MFSAMKQKRYPGVKPFEAADKALFFGRQRDIADLSDLIALERLVVLFGKSGYGKSSLINAGIIPGLSTDDQEEELIQPLLVRLGSYQEGQSKTPLENLLGRLREISTETTETAFLDGLAPERSLWYHFNRRQTASGRRYLLILDQFEEFFTYPPAQQQAFKTELAELLYVDTPQAIRRAAAGLDKAQRRLLATPLEVKLLLAIRSDRMSLLDSMKDKLPAILHKRFELKGLTNDQARAAIEKPAISTDGNFAALPFTYSEAALNLMVDKLSETWSAGHSGIEAFQLQILCEYLEGEIIAGRIPNNRIEPQHFESKINNIYEGYYLRLIGKLEPPSARPAAQQLIEEGLIFQDAQTGEARRLSVDADVLVQRFGPPVSQELLRQLESTFLLRREASSTGGFNYEVSHDTLLAPIQKSRDTRIAREAAERERAQAKRRQKRLATLLAAALLALALVTAAVLYVLKLRNDAVREKQNAENALNDLIIAQRAKERIEFKNLLSGIERVLTKNCPDAATLTEFDTQKNKYQEDAELNVKISEIDQKLIPCR
ncbi:MAG: hypothetical protein H6574_18675 [Lewinellaceae bacterium]|nr:hypothetical protein [Lewinellaceae bacterium]